MALQLSHPLLQHPVLFKELFGTFERLSLHFERELLLQAEQLQPQHQLIPLAHPQALRLRLAEHQEELLGGGDERFKSGGQILLAEGAGEDEGLVVVGEADCEVVVAQLEERAEGTDVPGGLLSLHKYLYR